MTAVTIAPVPILQFFNNLGAPNVGGTILTQVGGINYATYQDSAGTVPLPNPIPLNSRGEISNAAGLSTQLFLVSNIAYVFTMFDVNGNQLNQSTYVAGTDSTSAIALAAANGSTLVTFTQAGTGAVSRTLQSKDREIVSLTDFFTPAQIADSAVFAATLDVTVPMQAALTSFGTNGGLVYAPVGAYKWTSVLTPGQGVGIWGTGASTQFRPTSSGFRFPSNSNLGELVVRDFYMFGADITQFTAIEFMQGTAIPVAPRIDGLVMSGVTIDSFLIGLTMKNVWHSSFRGVVTNRCKNGIQVLGQCVSVTFDSCKLYRGIAGSVDGSIGFLVDQSAAYVDLVSRRPEAVRLTNETIIFAYDTQVLCNTCLVFSVVGCDIDFSVTYGVRVVICNGGCYIEGNWIAGDQAAGGVPKLVLIDALGSISSDLIIVQKNNLSFTGTVAQTGSYGIRFASNRTGNNVVKGNYIAGDSSPGCNYGLYLDSANPVVVEDNYIGGGLLSLFSNSSQGHTFKRNKFNGPIQRTIASVDNFERNTGSAVTAYHGPVTIPAFNASTTLTLASLGLSANPVQGAPANLQIKTLGYQMQGTVDRGTVRAYYDGAGNLVIKTPTTVGSILTDIWVDMEAF